MERWLLTCAVSILGTSAYTRSNLLAGSSCSSWSGGSASFSESNGNWIYATKQSGGAQDTTSQSANIDEHDDHETFKWSYANAKGGNSVNPLVSSGSSGGSGSGSAGSAPTSCVPRPAGAVVSGTATTGTATSQGSSRATSTKADDDDNASHHGWSSWTHPTARPTGNPGEDNDKRAPLEERQDINYCDENDPSNDPSNSGFTPIGSSDASNAKMMLIAHGTLAALAFVIFFPSGAIAIRLASFSGVVWFHAAFQAFAYLVYIAAFGLGVHIAKEQQLVCIPPFHPHRRTQIVLALRNSPHHRHRRLRCPLLPANPRLRASRHVQEIPDAHRMVAPALVAGPRRYHAGHHQWRAGTATCG
jgi:hypothetical protein